MKSFSLFAIPILFLFSCATAPHREAVIGVSYGTLKAPYVDATIFGEKRNFVFDSGSDRPFIKVLPAAVKEKDLITKGGLITVNGLDEGVKAFDADIQFGNTKFPSIIASYSPRYRSESISLNAILSDRMIFDFQNNKIILGQKADFCEATEPFKIDRELFFVQVKMNRQSVWLLWDTGSETSFLKDSWAKENKLLPYLMTEAKLNAPTLSKKKSMDFYKMKATVGNRTVPFEFAGITFDESLNMFFSALEGAIGYDFIKNRRWYFDLNEKRYCFE